MKREKLNEYCTSIGIDIKGKNKIKLVEEIKAFEYAEIAKAKEEDTDLTLLYSKIEKLSLQFGESLNKNIETRKAEMLLDDNSHYLIYRALGISEEEGPLIDQYQNTGRFLYKYAGSFLEAATVLCLTFNNLEGKRTLIENTISSKPKKFEIDFLDNNNAIEIKWRDATTDGDHITKEHTRVKCIKTYNYTPIRIMFYYPQRNQAIKIQETLEVYYKGVEGEYYAGKKAWDFIKNYTGYDLFQILTDIVENQKK